MKNILMNCLNVFNYLECVYNLGNRVAHIRNIYGFETGVIYLVVKYPIYYMKHPKKFIKLPFKYLHKITFDK